jgi:hypothetical protein
MTIPKDKETSNLRHDLGRIIDACSREIGENDHLRLTNAELVRVISSLTNLLDALRTLIASYQNELGVLRSDPAQRKEIDTLRAENARFRMALQRIAETGPPAFYRDIARAALEKADG